MIVQKLLQAESSHFAEKQPYKKPQYKSFRELLHLDRPRKKISYESEEENDDFLQKLLNQQKQKEKNKKNKKKIRKSEQKSDGRHSPKDKSKQSIFNRELSQAISQKLQVKPNSSELKHFFSVREVKQEERITPVIDVKLQQKSVSNIHASASALKKKPLNPVKLDGVANPIFIDQNSKQIPKLTYLSSDKAFEATLSTRKQIAYQQLLVQKSRYRKTIIPEQAIDSNLVERHILHKIKNNYQSLYSFSPNIQPVTQHWRYNLTFGQQNQFPNRQSSQFIDRRSMFKNKLEQQRFARSLKEYPKKSK